VSKKVEYYNDAIPEGVRKLTAKERRRHEELGVTGRYRSLRLPPHLWGALQWQKDYRTPLGRRVRAQYELEWAAADRIEAADIEAEDRTEYLPPEEQKAFWDEVGFEFYQSPDEPIAAYPAEACEDASEPAGLTSEQVLQEYSDAYLYGKGGTFLNSPGARLRFRREEAAAARYYREICIKQEAASAARDAAAAAPRPPRIPVAA
jgi:hypothetical protein